ncbi:MAG: hypothetical protein ACETVY_03800 [Candidatus Bathyarchaeia archaeon]
MIASLDEGTVQILRELKDESAIDPESAVTVSELVRKKTGFSRIRSPLSFGLEYHNICHRIRKLLECDLINLVQNEDGESFYLTEDGERCAMGDVHHRNYSKGGD